MIYLFVGWKRGFVRSVWWHFICSCFPLFCYRISRTKQSILWKYCGKSCQQDWQRDIQYWRSRI